MDTTRPALTPEAVQAWSVMRELALAQRGRLLGVAAEAGLSPPQLFALLALTPGEPEPMSNLAEVLRCDASNVTGLIDRLAGRGLVERRPAPHDRRIRHLVLTDAGIALRDHVTRRLDEPPDGFAALSPEEAALLRDLVFKIAATER